MKLMFCEVCGDGFFLRRQMRRCSCGRVRGRYVDDLYAEVSGKGVSIGIGNGSLQRAIDEIRRHEVAGTIPTDTRTDGCKMVGHIKFAWVRPNTGPYNPHTSIIQEDEKNVI